MIILNFLFIGRMSRFTLPASIRERYEEFYLRMRVTAEEAIARRFKGALMGGVASMQKAFPEGD